MVTSVSSLLKTVKNVEDEAGKGVRTLENAIERIASEITVRSTSHIYSVYCPANVYLSVVSSRTMKPLKCPRSGQLQNS